MAIEFHIRPHAVFDLLYRPLRPRRISRRCSCGHQSLRPPRRASLSEFVLPSSPCPLQRHSTSSSRSSSRVRFHRPFTELLSCDIHLRFLNMPPPPDTFVKLCASAKIALPAAKDRTKFLVDAGTPPPSGTSSRDISERTAALVWSLASLARKEDPSTWTTSLPAALHPTLLALYPLPPWRGPGAAPPDFARLATILELYAPDGAPQAAGAPQGAGAPSNAQPPPSGSDGININRPPDSDGGWAFDGAPAPWGAPAACGAPSGA